MIKIINSTKKKNLNKFKKIIHKRSIIDDKLNKDVRNIINNVKKYGDKSLIYYEKKFNDNIKIIPSNKDIEKSIKSLDLKIKKEIFYTYKRIFKWHKLQKVKNITYKDTYGNKFSYITKPIKNVACYCPYNLPSSALMNCIPASIAGVKRIVLATPAIGGKLNSAVMYAAKLCGVKEIINISGAGAIAALAYGTKTIKPVDLIVGPGSSYVASAKRILSANNMIAQERMFAGESEIVCWADNSVTADQISYSLLAQAEHSEGVMAVMISKDLNLIKKVKSKIEINIKNLPRKKIISKSLRKYGALIYCKTDKDILDLIEYLSPEHLELSIKNYKKYLYKLDNKLSNIGSIAAGPNSSMALSDYGPTQHSLPTSTTARYSGGLKVADFIKQISINELSSKGLKFLSKSGYILANEENLKAHSLSIKSKVMRRN